MTKHIKKFKTWQLTERARIEAELSVIPQLHPSIQRITSAVGFVDYYLQMRDLYNTQVEAYERLEEFHIAITGRRRYAEFDSFRGVVAKNLNRLL